MISLREFVRPVWAPHPRHRHVKPAFAQKERRFASTLHTKDVNSLVVSALKSDESQEVVTNGASPPEEQGGKGVPAEANFLAGNACLLVVSLLWGSYNPALRAVFTLPGGPDPLVVAAARGLLQAVLLGGATYLTFLATQHNKAQDEPKAPKTQSNGSGSQKPLTIPRNILSGIEIGLYNTCGTLLQTWGLSVSGCCMRVPAMHDAFDNIQ